MENAFTITHLTACLSNHGSVLVVDDNQPRRNALALLLGMVHFNVSLAGSASEGLTLARQGEFDLILINSHPIGDNGAELCRQIRDFNKRTALLLYPGETQNVETRGGWLLTEKQGMGLLPACA